MNIADIISATMLATTKHDDLLPMKTVCGIDISNDKIIFNFVDANTEDYTIDKDGNPTILKAKGRHDPCVLPRAVPVVEAMTAIVILDAYLLNKTTHI